MICRRCGTEIDTRIRYEDNIVQCPNCGAVYHPKKSNQKSQTSQQTKRATAKKSIVTRALYTFYNNCLMIKSFLLFLFFQYLLLFH